MAQELEKRGHKVGSAGYFAGLNSSGILGYILRPQYSARYEDCIKSTASMANMALRTVLDDLRNHAPMLSFMDSGDLSRLSLAIVQLEKLCDLVGERLSDAADCLDYLHLSHRDTQLQSRASQRDLENAIDILRGSGSYDLPNSRERIFEQAIRGDILPDEEALRFLDDLQGGNGSDQLEDLWRMWQYQNNPRDYEGRWGVIGSERYVEGLENAIFGSSFSSSDLSQGDYNYGDSLVKDLQDYVYKLNDDVNLTPNDEYMIYENRQRMLEAADELGKVTYYSKSWLEGQMEKLRRLEDFDNKVIEFDTSGEVRAEMRWEKGKNVMCIEADVYFIQWSMNGTLNKPVAPTARRDNYDDYAAAIKAYKGDQTQEFEKRVAHSISNFELWGGSYQVFDNQDLEVKVKINRVYSSGNAAVVRIADLDFPRSFAWGGTLPNIFDWRPEKEKSMGLFSDVTQNAVAQHEFGHWLGLQDAYAEPNKAWGGLFPLHGVPVGLYPDYDEHTIMNSTGNNKSTGQGPRATNNDIEMVVLAFQTGKRQNYQLQFPGDEISVAMGRGN